jgi:hypothetical protein
MSMWWQYLIAAAVLAVAIAGFISMTRLQTGNLTRHTERRAEDLYGAHAGATRRQRRDARAHRGT